MATLVAKTPGEIIVEVLRLLNDLVEEFTATAGTSSTITLGNVAIDAIAGNDDFYNNLWIYSYDGTGAGDERAIKDYAGTTRVATIAPNWTTTPDTTTKCVISRRFRPGQVYLAIQEAIRELAQTIHTPMADASLRMGSILPNGHFEYWDGSAAVSSGSRLYGTTGWTVQGTSATATRESTVARNSSPWTQYSAKLANGAGNAGYLEYLVPDWGRWAGKTISAKAWVYASAATRARLRINDGVTSSGDYSSYHTGTAGWQELSISDFAVAAAATKLGLELRTETGGAINVYFDDARLIPAQFEQHLWLPTAFTFLTEVVGESNQEGLFNLPVPPGFYRVRIHDNGEPYLEFDPDLFDADNPTFTNLGGLLIQDRHIKIAGTGYRTDTIAVTTDIEIAPQAVKWLAAARVAESAISGDSAADRFFANKADLFRREAEAVIARQPRRRPTSSMRVRS